jgi:hypothetical protein
VKSLDVVGLCEGWQVGAALSTVISVRLPVKKDVETLTGCSEQLLIFLAASTRSTRIRLPRVDHRYVLSISQRVE